MKNSSLIILRASLCALVLSAAASYGASNGSDAATNPAYANDDLNPFNDSNPAINTNGWVVGDNGGTGLGTWSTFSTAGSGGRYIGGTGLGATTFGVFAGGGGGNTSSVDRAFSGGGLSSGQTFSIDLGHSTSIAGGGVVGINLLDGSTPVLTLKFTGGTSFWQLNDGGLDFNIGQGYAANTPLTFTFTYDGGSQYDYTFGSASGSNFTATSTISNITGVRVFSNAQGGGENVGANNISIVPEPSSFVLAAISALGLGLIRRRRA